MTIAATDGGYNSCVTASKVAFGAAIVGLGVHLQEHFIFGVGLVYLATLFHRTVHAGDVKPPRVGQGNPGSVSAHGLGGRAVC